MVTPAWRRALLGVALLAAQPGHTAPVPDKTWAAMTARLFPMVTVLGQKTHGAANEVSPLPDRQRRVATCNHVASCLVRAEIWSDEEIAAIADIAERAPGAAAIAADDGVRAQVERELHGINTILQVYGLGSAPRYPAIDGPVVAATSAEFPKYVAVAAVLAEAASADPAVGLDPSIGLALALLDVNDRDTAAQFEPLDHRYNAGALARARKIDWTHYRYTAIIVTGVGPDTPGTALSPPGKLNVRMAASRIADGDAAFVLLSGGGVHPRNTPFIEALEMRKALIERYGVPADRIIVDPYARHTTTNLRNATRRMAALSLPLDREALVLTNTEQSQYIASTVFRERNQRELGYQPGTIGARNSPFELVFRPAKASLRIDPSDPLDP